MEQSRGRGVCHVVGVCPTTLGVKDVTLRRGDTASL